MVKLLKRIVPNQLKRQVKLLLHSGSKYLCPFCEYSSKDLSILGKDFPVIVEKQIVGAGLRNGRCYKCKSRDRERLIYVYLKEVANVFASEKNLSILHIAPEKHLTKALLRSDFKEYVCGDLFMAGYAYAEHVENINILNIPYSADRFDIVICNHVLEHIDQDSIAMKELYRVLKPGGFAILQVPISKNSDHTFEDFSITNPKEREEVFGQFDHVRIYGQDYTQRLERSGFKVRRVNISEQYSKYGLNPEEDLFIGEK